MVEVITLTALSDNYMYLLIDTESRTCSAIDPVEPNKILDSVMRRQLNLTSVLTTHHHSDHAGGNINLVSKLKELGMPDIKVYGGDHRIEGLTDKVSHGDKLDLGKNLTIHCLSTPCHTIGHMCYYVSENGSSDTVVFTGDTLFLGGCGRFFEGNANQMHKALITVLGQLPYSTKVYCGHEYTLKNLQFALLIEPQNEDLRERIKKVEKIIAAKQPTVPGTIKEELATNPFMRVTQPTVLKHCNTDDPIKAMQIVRKEKDIY